MTAGAVTARVREAPQGRSFGPESRFLNSAMDRAGIMRPAARTAFLGILGKDPADLCAADCGLLARFFRAQPDGAGRADAMNARKAEIEAAERKALRYRDGPACARSGS